ncbi:MAG: helix-hairpin-helix domain-containing protein [Verrucomicrobiota bacterium]
MSLSPWIAALLITGVSQAFAAAPDKPLQKIEKCTYVPAEWADGDSFQIKTPAGELHTIRLYGADCIEWHVSDDSDARRLRAQRQYFGITGAALKSQDAIELAKGFGKAAAEKTAAMLAKPFSIHTRFRDALGDGKQPRIYAFIECSDGTDLATDLVKSGLARAFGVYADGPGGRSSKEYEKILDDLELQAAKRGLGVWAKTDWDKLPAERLAQRRDEEEVNLAIGKSATPADFKINPNTAARDDLMKLPGIGEEMANRIIEHRPYQKVEDLKNVPSIKEKSLEKIRPYLDLQKP